MRVTLDASVWLSAISPAESAHDACSTLIAALVNQRVELHQPGLFIVEVAAAIARRTRSKALAMDASRAALAAPLLALYELDHQRAATAANIAAVCTLRGADAVYVATARDAGAILITLDRELLERGASVVSVQAPSDWMLMNPALKAYPQG